MTDVQRSLVLVKPDGVRRGLSGEVLRRIDERGLLQARGAVRSIASRLGVSRAVIYQDLKADDELV